MPQTIRFEREDRSPNDALFGLWTEVFNQPRSLFETAFASCAEDECPCFTAYGDDELAAGVQLFVLRLRDQSGRPERVGAIGNVSTRLRYRGLGLSTKLLESAISAMEKLDCGWSYLFTGIPAFYERLGWRSYERTAFEVEVAEVPEAGPVEIGIGDARPLYEQGQSSTPLSLVRGDRDWSEKIPARLIGCSAWHLSDGYAVARPDGEGLGLEEWAVPSGSVEDYRRFLHAAAQLARENGMERITITAPVPEEVVPALSSLKPIKISAGMARPVREDWTYERLGEMFSRPNACFFRLDAF